MPFDPWPPDRTALERVQNALAQAADDAPLWTPSGVPLVAAVFVASKGVRLFAAAAVYEAGSKEHDVVIEGRSSRPYEPGFLALREGPVLEQAIRSLPTPPDVVVVNATGRDHPRGAGLALHLGAVLDTPTVGVTDRPLLAEGPMPDMPRGSATPLAIGAQTVGSRLRTRTGANPVCVHAAWRTDPETAQRLVEGLGGRARTPRPLREARRLARRARSTR